MTIFEELKERGLIYQSTDEVKLKSALDNQKLTAYLGVDATADSAHIGHLVPLIILSHLERSGHNVVLLVGGGTAMIGDPSGRSDERVQIERSVIEVNAQKISEQIKRFASSAQMVDNYDWLSKLELVPFLRDIGSKFRVNDMIKAEGYKERLERESGLSFLEFSYQLMQAYDFLKLHEDHGCDMQIGGSDQWGNIVAGVSLVRKVKGEEVHAFTAPLLTTSDGKKMGKTVGGAVWLDSEKTSPYEFYQYWINVSDEDVSKFLKIFTFLSLEEIAEFEQLSGPDIRVAKEKLAFEVTKLVHGEDEAKKVEDASRSAFGSGGDDSALPTIEVFSSVFGREMNVIDFLMATKVLESRGEARRLVEQGGVYINDKSMDSLESVVTQDHFSDDELMLRLGKKRHYKVVIS